MTATTPFSIRPAEPRDVEAIVGLIHELAAYEKLAHLCVATPALLAPQLFGARPNAEALVVDVGGTGGAVVAFALYFGNFSTFLSRPGLYLEDVYVQPAHRGRGIATALMRHLATEAVARGCGRFDWSVLDWNATAIAFYQRLGAEVLPDWRTCRVTGEALQRLAGS